MHDRGDGMLSCERQLQGYYYALTLLLVKGNGDWYFIPRLAFYALSRVIIGDSLEHSQVESEEDCQSNMRSIVDKLMTQEGTLTTLEGKLSYSSFLDLHIVLVAPVFEGHLW